MGQSLSRVDTALGRAQWAGARLRGGDVDWSQCGVGYGEDVRVAALSKVYGVPRTKDYLSMYPEDFYTKADACRDLVSWRKTGKPSRHHKNPVPQYHKVFARFARANRDPIEYVAREIYGYKKEVLKMFLESVRESNPPWFTRDMALHEVSRKLWGKPPRYKPNMGFRAINKKHGFKYKPGRAGYSAGYTLDPLRVGVFERQARANPKTLPSNSQRRMLRRLDVPSKLRVCRVYREMHPQWVPRADECPLSPSPAGAQTQTRQINRNVLAGAVALQAMYGAQPKSAQAAVAQSKVSRRGMAATPQDVAANLAKFQAYGAGVKAKNRRKIQQKYRGTQHEDTFRKAAAKLQSQNPRAALKQQRGAQFAPKKSGKQSLPQRRASSII